MAPRGGQPHDMGEQGRSLFHEKIATFYYTFGLFSISYPVYVLLFSISIIVISWFPLVNLPYPGKAPHAWTGNLSSADISEPFCYVQQVVMRVTVLPWESDLTLGDAFRAPLYESFKLLDIVRNHQNEQSMKTLGHVCLHIEAVKKGKLDPKGILPQYNCLVLSPANLWHQDVHRFSQDRALLTTVFNQHSFQKGKTSIAEILFGMHLFDTGIKRYPIRNRQRIIQYAVTLFYNEYDEQFIESLHHKLIRLYPLHQNDSVHIPLKAQDTLFIQYPGEINYIEVSPIVVSFIIIFMYYYFSVRKIEMIKSKVGMALTATITVFCSLTTTMGICFFFGLTMHFCGSKGIFPYLVMLVGLENVLVLTKSVVSTPLHLDVKIRNAQGLSREGWSITKNLMFELTVMTFGLFTFVPVIQEFSIFCIVALIMDYFLQIFFFATILGIDISRTVNSNEKTTQNYRYSLYQTPNSFEKQINMKSMTRSKSHPRLSAYPTNVVAAQKQGTQEKRIPKRLQLVNIWARTRFFQRSFMLLMIVYISMIVYNSDLINQYILNVVQEKDKEDNNSLYDAQNYKTVTMFPLIDPNNSIPVKYVTYKPVDNRKSSKLSLGYTRNETQGLEKLKHPEYSAWQKLSLRHWFTILRKYNISLSAKTIAVLPCIKLSHVISPEQAVLIRNPDEKYGDKFHWQALAAALDPIDFTDTESSEGAIPQQDQPFYPTSPMEILLTTILCVISILVLSYTLVVVYRCVCSRNYAEWRASWSNEKSEESGEEQVLLEAVPIVLDGHQQEIECLSTDGTNIVSTCLDGHLKVWDSNTGQLVIHIDRNSYFVHEKRQDLSLEYDDTFSDYESGSPPSREDNFPKLLNKINTDFSHNVDGECSTPSDSKYDFNKSYRHFYFNHNYDVRLRHKYDCSQSDSKRHSLSGDNNWKPTQFHSENLKDDVSEYRNNSVPNVNSAMSSRDVSDHNNCENCRLSPIWCIDYLNNLIVIGCADGRLEFWEGSTGKLKCIFEDETESGISHVKMVGCKIIATRLSGTLELYQLQTYNQGRPVDWNFSCAYRRTHVRTGSLGSNSEGEGNNQIDNVEDLHVIKLHTVRAHQQPITCLDCEGGRILTGSQDHTLKVFRLDDTRPLYTLHGHCGPITCLFIDRISPGTSGSGSQDGMLCVWDLMTGACMYSIQAHDGSITSLTYSTSYVISLGTDERLCVWERFQGHLLNTIYVSHTFSNKVLMLAQHLAITGRSSGLVIWDVRTGECVRTITLGHIPFIFINQLLLLRDAVVCDYGKQLSIVRFPLITHKFD